MTDDIPIEGILATITPERICHAWELFASLGGPVGQDLRFWVEGIHPSAASLFEESTNLSIMDALPEIRLRVEPYRKYFYRSERAYRLVCDHPGVQRRLDLFEVECIRTDNDLKWMRGDREATPPDALQRAADDLKFQRVEAEKQRLLLKGQWEALEPMLNTHVKRRRKADVTLI